MALDFSLRAIPTLVRSQSGWRAMVIAVLAVPVGVVLTMPPLNLWPLAFVMLVPLFVIALDERSTRWTLICTALLAGALFWAVGNHGFLLDIPHRWLLQLNPVSIWFLSIGIFVGLSLAFGLLWVVGVLVTRAFAKRGIAQATLFGGVVWVVLEMLGTLITGDVGFGTIIGYSLPASSPFGQVAQLGSVWLVSFGLILVNLLIAHAWVTQPTMVWSIFRPALGVLVVWSIIGTGLWLWNRGITLQAETIRAVAIQRHRISSIENGDPMAYDVQLLAAQADQTEPTLIVLPEVAYGVDKESNQRMSSRPGQLVYPNFETLYAASQQKLVTGTTLIAGVVDTTNPTGWFNKAVAVSRDGHFGATSKRQLLPLGEELPLAKFWPQSIQSRYVNAPVPAHARVVTPLGMVSVLFCNELLAPGYARADVAAGATVVTAIASNFDVPSPLYAAWQIRAASYRAVETGRSVVLAADQTRSAILRPTGTAVSVADYKSTGSIEGEISLRTDQTLWVRLAPLWSIVLLILSLVALQFIFWRRSS